MPDRDRIEGDRTEKQARGKIEMNEADKVRHVFERGYAERLATKDPKIYGEQFTEDGIQMPPGVPDRVGRAAIAAAFAQQVQQVTVEPELKADEVEAIGDFAYVMGTARAKVTPLAGGESKQLVFRAIWLLRKEQEEWKIARQIWHEKTSES